jgi:hypothetical protein
VVVHACNPSTWKAETVGLRVPDQPGLHSDTLSSKQTNKQTKSLALHWLQPVVLRILSDFYFLIFDNLSFQYAYNGYFLLKVINCGFKV